MHHRAVLLCSAHAPGQFARVIQEHEAGQGLGFRVAHLGGVEVQGGGGDGGGRAVRRRRHRSTARRALPLVQLRASGGAHRQSARPLRRVLLPGRASRCAARLTISLRPGGTCIVGTRSCRNAWNTPHLYSTSDQKMPTQGHLTGRFRAPDEACSTSLQMWSGGTTRSHMDAATRAVASARLPCTLVCSCDSSTGSHGAAAAA